MKKDIAERWVTALRSEKYPQGRSALCTRTDGVPTGFCCLGVLCDLAAQEGVGGWMAPASIAVSDTNALFECPKDVGVDGDRRSGALLPAPVMVWAGMRTWFGEFVGKPAGQSLVALNDDGKSFTEIADEIERNWEEL